LATVNTVMDYTVRSAATISTVTCVNLSRLIARCRVTRNADSVAVPLG
jgi:hypothetical protein